MSLPIVNQEVAFSLDHELNENDWVAEQLARLEEVNPVIRTLIHEATQDETLHNAHGVAYIALLVYRMLETQDECDELSEMLNG